MSSIQGTLIIVLINVLSKEGRRGLRDEVGRILLKGVSGGSGSGC